MGTSRVGIREFRDKLASYLLESDAPVAITRHGDTVGYYIPARPTRSDSERDALREVAARMQTMLAAEGISEEEVLADYKTWRKGGRERKAAVQIPEEQQFDRDVFLG
jgi:PHD/YefM family antitoxin component YafN of YafNO toxin-antitoxin module